MGGVSGGVCGGVNRLIETRTMELSLQVRCVVNGDSHASAGYLDISDCVAFFYLPDVVCDAAWPAADSIVCTLRGLETLSAAITPLQQQEQAHCEEGRKG